MLGRSRVRRALKWLGTALCATLLAAWGGSYGPIRELSLIHSFAFLHRGRAIVSVHVEAARSARNQWLREQLTSAAKHLPMEYAFLHEAHSSGAWHVLDVPLWILLAVVAAPTGVLWYVDRRRNPPGHCRKCGYNLTGNVSGRCPECGTIIAPDAH
jgi:hypothetical protein